ncbi:MAG: hypothetical protein IT181_18720 [Acidobacteria bacterium]|nr:hypothetical protein [Acidobacteriota bacterium]
MPKTPLARRQTPAGVTNLGRNAGAALLLGLLLGVLVLGGNLLATD